MPSGYIRPHAKRPRSIADHPGMRLPTEMKRKTEPHELWRRFRNGAAR